MENSNPQLISRKQHYYYVLVFSVVVWLFIAAIVGGLVPVKYAPTGECKCRLHETYSNISFLFYGIGGVVAGFVFSYPFHRWMLVAYSKPEDVRVPFAKIARYGKVLWGWWGLVVLLGVANVYVIEDYVLTRFCGRLHATDISRLENGVPTLYCAVARGDISTVKLELEKTANVRNDFSDSLLRLAVRKCDTRIAELLISKGANVNAVLQQEIEINEKFRRIRKKYFVAPLDFAKTEAMKRLLCSHGAKTGEELLKEKEQK